VGSSTKELRSKESVIVQNSNAVQNGISAKGAITAVKAGAAIIVTAWLGFPAAIRIMVMLMGLDMATGIMSAAIEGRVSSEISIRGLVKKISIAVAVLFVHLLDGMLLPMFGIPMEELGLEKIFAIYIAFSEAISIIENLAKCGVPFPMPVVKALSQIKEHVPRPATQAEIDALGTTTTTTTTTVTAPTEAKEG
jgi:toxin secretion/phage lysis holin